MLLAVCLATDSFIDSATIYTKGGRFYYPNIGIIPEGSVLIEIGFSIGGQIDRLATKVLTPSNQTIIFDGFGSNTRSINVWYPVSDGNRIHTIRLGTFLANNGEKSFGSIQFLGTKESSPYYEGGFKAKITKNEYINLDYRPVAFFGYIETQTRSICGLGVVMSKPVAED
jgi:hypothetical protein